MKSIFLLLFLLFFVIPSTAQETCNLQVNAATAPFGLKLEMSPEQVQSIFGKDLKIKIKKKGWRVFVQNFVKEPAPSALSGVRALYLRFFDRKLYQIEIFYENQNKWQTVEDFTADLSAKLNLPANFWQDVKGKRELDCTELSFVADKILNPRIEITDKATNLKVEELRRQESKK
jgi:hypothetical protein